MRRLLGVGLGSLVLIAPNRVVETAERLAFEDADAGRLRPWTLPIARVKGLLVCWLLIGGRRSGRATAATLGPPAAVLGAVLALAPRSALRFGLAVAYENPDDLEVKPRVVPAARLLGACYLAAGLFARRAGRSTSDSRIENADPPRDV